jgi:hypothetical protein
MLLFAGYYISPNMAVVFARIFLNFHIVPLGQVFGSRSAPSYFSLLSAVRAEVTSTVDLTSPADAPLECLAAMAEIAPLPDDWDPTISLSPA